MLIQRLYIVEGQELPPQCLLHLLPILDLQLAFALPSLLQLLPLGRSLIRQLEGDKLHLLVIGHPFIFKNTLDLIHPIDEHLHL